MYKGYLKWNKNSEGTWSAYRLTGNALRCIHITVNGSVWYYESGFAYFCETIEKALSKMFTE